MHVARRWSGGFVAGLTVLAALVAFGNRAEARAPRSVVATASAQGVRMTYTVPNYMVVSELFDGGGPVSNAVADSTGRGSAFSALPWPGENAVTGPGTLSAAMGRSVPLAYPFYVQADYPTTQSAELKDPSGGYALAATAGSGLAAASGSMSGGPAGDRRVSGSETRSSATVDDGGVVRVVAESVDTGLAAGEGMLRIGSVRSRSETVLCPDDPKPVTVNELVVEAATVGGRSVTIDRDGVHLADQTAAGPGGDGLSSENEMLGRAGITAKIVPASVAGGADQLLITSTQTMPVPNQPKGTLVVRLGGAASHIEVGSADESEPQLGAAGPGPEAAQASPAGPPEAALAVAPSLPGPARSAEEAPDALPVPSTTVASSNPGLTARDGVPLPPLTDERAQAATGGLRPETRAAAPAVARPTAGPVPDLATTGALFSIMAFGAAALLFVTRVYRWRLPRSER